jgi:hypothetical protein
MCVASSFAQDLVEDMLGGDVFGDTFDIPRLTAGQVSGVDGVLNRNAPITVNNTP